MGGRSRVGRHSCGPFRKYSYQRRPNAFGESIDDYVEVGGVGGGVDDGYNRGGGGGKGCTGCSGSSGSSSESFT